LWLRWHELETAGAWALLSHVSEDSDIALLAPVCTPGVLDDPVVLPFLGAVSNKQDTVIEACTAEMLDDTAPVELPREAAGVKCNGDWTVLEGLSEGDWVLVSNVGESGYLCDAILRLARRSSSAFVWILGFGIHL